MTTNIPKTFKIVCDKDSGWVPYLVDEDGFVIMSAMDAAIQSLRTEFHLNDLIMEQKRLKEMIDDLKADVLGGIVALCSDCSDSLFKDDPKWLACADCEKMLCKACAEKHVHDDSEDEAQDQHK